MRLGKVSVTLLILLGLIAATILPPLYFNSDVNADDKQRGTGSESDPFMIYSADDLAKVGKGANYPGYEDWTMSASYRLANDIIFGPEDNTNGGVMVEMTITYDDGEFTITIISDEGSNPRVQLGTNSDYTGNNTVIVTAPAEIGKHLISVGGNTSERDPFAYTFEIEIFEDMTGWAMDPIVFDSNGNFDPIVHYSYRFTGTFDGAGYKISGAEIAVFTSSGENQHIGLFGYTERGTIKDVSIVGGHSTSVSSFGKVHMGGLIGYAQSSSIYNCYNASNITATTSSDPYIGGLIGYANSSQISNCYNTGDVVLVANSGPYAGGIIGYTGSSPVSNCYNTGDVTMITNSAPRAGGIAGGSSSLVSNCYNTGNITATCDKSFTYAGGIAGTSTTSSLVSNCYNTGNITANSSSDYINKGGIAGSYYSSIANSFFLKDGDLGLTGPGEVEWDEISGPRESTELKDPDEYTGWSFSTEPTDWSIIEDINEGYPILNAFLHKISVNDPDNGSVSTENTIYGFVDIVVTILPGEGYWIKKVTDNGTDVTGKVLNNEYLISFVSMDHAVVVEFESLLYIGTDGPNDEDPRSNLWSWLTIFVVVMIIIFGAFYVFGIKKE